VIASEGQFWTDLAAALHRALGDILRQGEFIALEAKCTPLLAGSVRVADREIVVYLAVEHRRSGDRLGGRIVASDDSDILSQRQQGVGVEEIADDLIGDLGVTFSEERITTRPSDVPADRWPDSAGIYWVRGYL
jgi:hypothetical protein